MKNIFKKFSLIALAFMLGLGQSLTCLCKASDNGLRHGRICPPSYPNPAKYILLNSINFTPQVNLFNGEQDLLVEILTKSKVKKIELQFVHDELETAKNSIKFGNNLGNGNNVQLQLASNLSALKSKNPEPLPEKLANRKCRGSIFNPKESFIPEASNRRTAVLEAQQVEDTLAYSASLSFDDAKELGDWRLKLRITDYKGKQFSYTKQELSKLNIAHLLKVVNEEPEADTEEGFSAIDLPEHSETSGDLLEGATELFSNQPGLDTEIIDESLETIVRGYVFDHEHKPLAGVKVTIHKHDEYGYTKTAANGEFNMLVNGGERYTISYKLPGCLVVQRTVDVPLRDIWVTEDICLTSLDTQGTQINLNSSNMQVAESSMSSDEDGDRHAMLMIPPQTHASMTLADGSKQNINTATLRATEYTVGENGPAAMPGTLPATSAYTYALELSLDEAIAAGATNVEFDHALPFYVENFLNFPTGEVVPVGYYNRETSQWVPSENGRIVEILDIVNGKAILDVEGNGTEASQEDLDKHGISNQELLELGSSYQVGQSLWRVPIEHFTPWDCNWPYGPPADALAPPAESPESDDENNPDDPCKETGSIIECESQTLGEEIPITGTNLNLVYKSDRMPGRTTGRTIRIKLADDREIPGSLQGIELTILVAGRKIVKKFPGTRDSDYLFEWDGKDVYGRTLYGSVPVHIDIDYLYNIQYYSSSEEFERSFALPTREPLESPSRVIGQRGSQSIKLSKSYTKRVTNLNVNKKLGLGGWSLSRHHFYNPFNRTLLKGNGEIVSPKNTASVMKLIHNSNYNSSNLDEFIIGEDGKYYVLNRNSGEVWMLNRNGEREEVYGRGSSTDLGIHAKDFSFKDLSGLALADNGDIYVAGHIDSADSAMIWRIDKDTRQVYLYAGSDSEGFDSPDGTLALGATLDSEIFEIRFGRDACLYYSDFNRVRKIDQNGLLQTVAGKKSGGSFDEDIPATEADLYHINSFTFARNGDLYLIDNKRIRKVSQDGLIKTIAGERNTRGDRGDGGPALNALFDFPYNLVMDNNSNLYVDDSSKNHKIRVIDSSGNINKFVGVGGPYPFSSINAERDGKSTLETYITLIHGMYIDKTGALYIVENTSGSRDFIFKVDLPLPGYGDDNIVIPSSNGSEYYVFNKNGRHLFTKDSLTHATIEQFNYDEEGYLNSIQDSFANKTVIEREGKEIRAVVSPYGLRTEVNLDSDGYIASVVNPENETYQITYNAKGLLKTFTNPRGNTSKMKYDFKGRLTEDKDAEGGSWSLSRLFKKRGNFKVTMESAMGKKIVHDIKKNPDGTVDRSVTKSGSNRVNKLKNKRNNSSILTKADGTVIERVNGGDARFGMLAPIASKIVTTLPSGLKNTTETFTSAEFGSRKDISTMQSFSETRDINDRRFRSTYTAATKTLTNISANSRVEKFTYGDKGELILHTKNGYPDTHYSYDEKGKVQTITVGKDDNTRVTEFHYDDNGYLNQLIDAEGNTVDFDRDQIGRVESEQVNQTQAVEYGYDENSNLIGLTPPEKQEHAFDFTKVDLVEAYKPPSAANTGTNEINYEYDLDKKLTKITLADSKEIKYSYDDNEEYLTKIELERGDIELDYYKSGQLKSITAPGSEAINLEYDGFLLTKYDLDGTIDKDINMTYNNNFQLSSRAIEGFDPVVYEYDLDGVLTQVDDLDIRISIFQQDKLLVTICRTTEMKLNIMISLSLSTLKLSS